MTSHIPTTTTSISNNNNNNNNTNNTNTNTNTPPITRPIHPFVINPTKYNRSIEFCTWAHILPSSSVSSSSSSSSSTSLSSTSSSTNNLPNLITASNNSLCIYTIDSISSYTLQLYNHTLLSNIILSHLAGTIISLSTIPIHRSHDNNNNNNRDALLIGFAGHPRCVVLTMIEQQQLEEQERVLEEQQQEQHTSHTKYVWQVSTIIDMSQCMIEFSMGATSILEQDMILCINNHYSTNTYYSFYNNNTNTNNTTSSSRSNDTHDIKNQMKSKRMNHYSLSSSSTTTTTTTTSTAACILGGGIAIAILTFHATSNSQNITTTIIADEPYIIPLSIIQLPHNHHLHKSNTVQHTDLYQKQQLLLQQYQQYQQQLQNNNNNNVTTTTKTTTTIGMDITNNTTTTTTTSGLTGMSTTTTTTTQGNETNTSNTTNTGTNNTTTPQLPSFLVLPTGFGDIIDLLFLYGYHEPVIVMLHTTMKYGTITTGRYTNQNHYQNQNNHQSNSNNNTNTNTSKDDNHSYYYYYCTALSINTIHQRTAILWSIPIPTMDALYLSIPPPPSSSSQSSSNHHHNHNNQLSLFFMVVSNNSLLFIRSIDGIILQYIAMNGWANASNCSHRYYATTTATSTKTKSSSTNTKNNNNTFLSCNAIVKLSIQLEGCKVTWINPIYAFIILRYGQIYTLQYIEQQQQQQQWILLPIGYTLGMIGEIATSISLSFIPIIPQQLSSSLSSSFVYNGYILAGSRLGDSIWLRYTLDTIHIPNEIQHCLSNDNHDASNHETAQQDATSTISTTTNPNTLHMNGDNHHINNDTDTDDEDLDAILRIEDEALYGSGQFSHTNQRRLPDVIPPSDDETENMTTSSHNNRTITATKSQATNSIADDSNTNIMDTNSTMIKLRSIETIDCIVNVGPLGPSCSGPIDRAPSFLSQANNYLNDDIDNDDENDNNMIDDNTNTNMNTSNIYGAVAEIYPSGYGSSGGIAYMTVPGRDDRMIISETDCLHTNSIFTLPYHNIVLMGMSRKIVGSNTNNGGGGIRILQQVSGKMKHDGHDSSRQLNEMKEIYIEEWCLDTIGVGDTNYTDSWEVFQSILLYAGEYGPLNKQIILVVKAPDGLDTSAFIMKHNPTIQKMEIICHYRIDLPTSHPDLKVSSIVSVSPVTNEIGDNGAAFGCVWTNGDATLIHIGIDDQITTTYIQGSDPTDRNIKVEMDIDKDDDDDDDDDAEAKEIEKFYSNKNIVAIDTFQAPFHVFELSSKTAATTTSTSAMETSQESIVPDLATSKMFDEDQINNKEPRNWNIAYDAEDAELYSISLCNNIQDEPLYTPRNDDELNDPISQDDIGRMNTYYAVCRTKGNIDIYSVSAPDTLLWSICNANLGLPILTATTGTMDEVKTRLPRSHCIALDEIRFFICGPTIQSTDDTTPTDPQIQDLYLSIVTSDGDMYLYILGKHNAILSYRPIFRRVPLGSVERISQEQIRHHAKLSRKGVIGKVDTSVETKFKYNVLHRFHNISGQDGLFAAIARPKWIVCERGQIVALDHRMRHAAPAGGTLRPITSFGTIGFTPNIHSDVGNDEKTSDVSCSNGYITLHERVGRVGSQRLTLYKGLSNAFESHGILLGNGCCMEKVLLGVTVRRIVFIDDETISTGDHPLYAVLVSREVELDQSTLITDGLSEIERQQKEQEREAIKIQKQVEADLGGFDMESEWVESIERENCFHIKTDLGGAPPIHQSIYSVWIVDAARKWMVIDSYELDEYEHGIDLKIMYLTEFQDEHGGTTKPDQDPNNIDMVNEVPKRLFLAVGTGIVNHDGEDVSTKGRVLLFDIKRSTQNPSTLLSSTAPFAELVLAYEKTIFHGPVTTLSCLISDDDKRRLVIGAGSDVNIEMWNQPQKKLIQVGFFRATMHILDIVHFKNFLLLSDAYDSIYLLVFRESDKSLTLLAKDYDPIPVYATGIMTRGTAMTFVCHDDRQNLQFFQYTPGEAAARGGNKLVCRADFHLGKQTTNFRTHYCRPSLYIHSATPASTLAALKQQDTLFGRQDDDQRIGVNFGTTDGNIVSIIPLSEPVYWRLMALQSVMSNALESDCVLNHRAWRLYRRSVRRGGCRNNDRKKGVIDGDLIMKYPDLSITQQEDLASAIGSTVELILDNLLEAQCASMIL